MPRNLLINPISLRVFFSLSVGTRIINNENIFARCLVPFKASSQVSSPQYFINELRSSLYFQKAIERESPFRAGNKLRQTYITVVISTGRLIKIYIEDAERCESTESSSRDCLVTRCEVNANLDSLLIVQLESIIRSRL